MGSQVVTQPDIYCKACGRFTKGGKPYCSKHVLMMPYAAKVAATVAAAMLLFMTPAFGQVKEVQPPKERMTSRVIFVVDVSGSMSFKLGKAIAAVKMIMQQPVDQLEVSLIAFDDGVYKWPKGWVTLPDAQAVADADKWLAGFAGNGGTIVCPALKAAFKEPHPKETKNTVVLVTDGQFYQEKSSAVEAMEKLRKGPVMVLGVGVQVWSSLKALGKSGGVWEWT